MRTLELEKKAGDNERNINIYGVCQREEEDIRQVTNR